ncbi:tripartite tricarboxylate transporter permease [Paracoccus sp. TK19116]|uniref:Tripartite tricarboxylate transporter permease n=1 Tax=Paracoccus albicereus TaxID=2922394 RepID=A0ABT1MUS4_9RHOB|nr:tripartite tricarboxylate transporter permease [Paracoccus albicereus]MCQ0972090.1 tripartite tricarboxylate transporter permease [Paracoccus albicereus]
MPQFFLEAFGQVMSLHVIGLIALGVVLGIIGGSIPGFTVTMAILVVFPFTFAMDPVAGVSLMVGVFVGGYSGGLVSGVMLGIPGTPSSITTVYDGYPMAQKGEPGRALGIGILASFFGTIISVALLVVLGPLIAQFSMNFRPWEITALIVFALTLVASLSAGAMLKGLIAAGLGLLVTTVGYDRNSNLRFDFGFTSLESGLQVLPVLVGVFAFSQLLGNLEEKPSGPANDPVNRSVSIPYGLILRDMAGQKFNILRSSLIGALVGALPGTGGTVANFVSYDQAKKMARRPEEFGTGIPGGIVASEASNSAVAGGAFIPTLALGIPGDLPMAIMMGVLILHGINPGPLMFEENAVLVGSIYVSLLVAAVVMVLANFALVRWFAKISLIPQRILAPVVLVLCAVGSFALNNNLFDVWVLFGFGVVGYLLWKAGVPLTPLILGVVLGENFEAQLFRALELDDSWLTFVTRPISATLLALAVLSVVVAVMQNRRGAREAVKE